LIPFREPQETITYCRQFAERNPGGVIVFGDDGEKFGTWPDTKKHVYHDGWLSRFFDALMENRGWLKTNTLAEAVQETRACGKIYLPDASYREMTEWALPVERQIEFEKLVHDLQHQFNMSAIQPYLAGGFWRNFKVKYPESNEMYARMIYVSNLIEEAERNGFHKTAIEKAREHLYQGQCNCSYWHGAFGGIYLPHLRNAAYKHLIIAENLVENSNHPSTHWIEAKAADFDFDGQTEVRLANDKLAVWFAPHRGGQVYELDIREIGHNLLATMQRRSEAYHRKVRGGQQQSADQTASIHDRVVFKQEGLERCLHYDRHMRKSMIDHFWQPDVNLQSIANGEAEDLGDFFIGGYGSAVRSNPDRIQVVLKRKGLAAGYPLAITKGVTLSAGSSLLEIAYMLDGLPNGVEFHFGVEFNFSGLPEGQDDRFYSGGNDQRFGQLGSVLDLHQLDHIRLTDGWLGLSVALQLDRKASIWAFPIHSVSQSESGFELVHQSVVVQPHWIVRGDATGRWVVRMSISCELVSREHREGLSAALSGVLPQLS
jgi:alpha-amylase